MNLRWLTFLSLFLLVGCATSAYNPSYIISDTVEEKIAVAEDSSK